MYPYRLGACARELAPALGTSLESLLASPCASPDNEHTDAITEDELEIVWSAASEMMQNLDGPIVLMVRCDDALPEMGLHLLGRLVGKSPDVSEDLA